MTTSFPVPPSRHFATYAILVAFGLVAILGFYLYSSSRRIEAPVPMDAPLIARAVAPPPTPQIELGEPPRLPTKDTNAPTGQDGVSPDKK
jgi:hypothetical protein